MREYGKGRNKLLKILLSDDEHAQLVAIASAQDLETSTWARALLIAQCPFTPRASQRFSELQAILHLLAVKENNRIARNQKEHKLSPAAQVRRPDSMSVALLDKIWPDVTREEPARVAFFLSGIDLREETDENEATRTWIMKNHLEWGRLPTSFDYWRMYNWRQLELCRDHFFEGVRRGRCYLPPTDVVRQFIAEHILLLHDELYPAREHTEETENIEIQIEEMVETENTAWDAYFSRETPEVVREWLAKNILEIRYVPRQGP